MTAKYNDQLDRTEAHDREYAFEREQAEARQERERRMRELEFKIVRAQAFLKDYPWHTSLCSDIRQWLQRANEQLAMWEARS